MARKKVVFVIVEGPSDETALGVALSQMFDKESVHIHIMHGDFKESWEFIEEDMHSIERYTNLPICLTEEACM